MFPGLVAFYYFINFAISYLHLIVVGCCGYDAAFQSMHAACDHPIRDITIFVLFSKEHDAVHLRFLSYLFVFSRSCYVSLKQLQNKVLFKRMR